MYCPKCGTLSNDATFKCLKCGLVMQSVPHVREGALTSSQSNVIAKVAVGIGVFFAFFVISGIVAAIAIPAFLGYQARAANTLARTSAADACSVAKKIFQGNPQQIISVDDLRQQGFVPQPKVTITVRDGAMSSLSLAARHSKGTRVFLANRDCSVQEAPAP